MRTIQVYESAHGMLFKTLGDARKHTEDQYQSLLTKIAHNACVLGEFTPTVEYLESAHPLLEALGALAEAKQELDYLDAEELAAVKSAFEDEHD